MDETPETIEINDPDLLRLIDRDAPVERLCTGFRFSEGPIWNQKEQCLYFSDMPNDIRRRWSPRDGVVEVRNPSNMCNGMTYDAAGNRPAIRRDDLLHGSDLRADAGVRPRATAGPGLPGGGTRQSGRLHADGLIASQSREDL
jgi:sugar lactone lactonase YvrE